MQNIKKAWSFLDGKKTYILAVLGGVVFTLEVLGTIDSGTATQLYTILGIGGVATLRDAIRKKQ